MINEHMYDKRRITWTLFSFICDKEATTNRLELLLILSLYLISLVRFQGIITMCNEMKSDIRKIAMSWIWLVSIQSDNFTYFMQENPIARGRSSVGTPQVHISETDEYCCGWLQRIWRPPKRLDRESTISGVSRSSTKLIFAYTEFFLC